MQAAALVSTGPLSVLLDAENLQWYKGGVWNPDNGPFGCYDDVNSLDHAVLLVRPRMSLYQLGPPQPSILTAPAPSPHSHFPGLAGRLWHRKRHRLLVGEEQLGQGLG